MHIALMRLATSPVFALALAFASLPMSATTVVIKLEKSRVVLAADTRREVKTLHQSGEPFFHDDFCKVVALGNTGFAATGFSDYTRTDASDSVPNWSAYEDAKTAYSLHTGRLDATAEEWGRFALRHYQIFYLINPSRVTSLASFNPDNALVVGVFAGWNDDGSPSLILVLIKLDKTSNQVTGIKTVLPQRDLPYTTNAWTQQLIEGKDKSRKKFDKQWKKASKKFPKTERDWRLVEFLVQSTSDYDETVGKKVDVLQVLPSNSDWLQKSSCPVY